MWAAAIGMRCRCSVAITAVVTLDRETGVVRYIYGPHAHVLPAQWSIEFKPGASMGQVMPATPPEKK